MSSAVSTDPIYVAHSGLPPVMNARAEVWRLRWVALLDCMVMLLSGDDKLSKGEFSLLYWLEAVISCRHCALLVSPGSGWCGPLQSWLCRRTSQATLHPSAGAAVGNLCATAAASLTKAWPPAKLVRASAERSPSTRRSGPDTAVAPRRLSGHRSGTSLAGLGETRGSGLTRRCGGHQEIW